MIKNAKTRKADKAMARGYDMHDRGLLKDTSMGIGAAYESSNNAVNKIRAIEKARQLRRE
jgi:hypothetical protein